MKKTELNQFPIMEVFNETTTTSVLDTIYSQSEDFHSTTPLLTDGGRNYTVDQSLIMVMRKVDLFVLYVGWITIVVGILCNVLTLLTLMQPKLKESPYTYLKALTLADLTALMLTLVSRFKGDSYSWAVFIVYMYYPLVNVSAIMGIYLIVLLTVERWITVQFPIRMRERCTKSQARIKILVVFFFSVIVNVPRFMWYKPYLEQGPANASGNVTVAPRYTIRANLHSTEFAYVVTWMYSVVHNFFPIFLLLLFNTLIICKIMWIVHRQRPSLGVQPTSGTGPVLSSDQTRLTISLIAISCLFIICVLPSAFADVNIAKPLLGLKEREPQMVILQRLSNFCVWLNLSLNFFLYTFINFKFKQAFRQMLRQWKQKLRLLLDGLRSKTKKRRRGSQRGHGIYRMADTDEKRPLETLQLRGSTLSKNSKDGSCTTLSFRMDSSMTGQAV